MANYNDTHTYGGGDKINPGDTPQEVPADQPDEVPPDQTD